MSFSFAFQVEASAGIWHLDPFLEFPITIGTHPISDIELNSSSESPPTINSINASAPIVQQPTASAHSSLPPAVSDPLLPHRLDQIPADPTSQWMAGPSNPVGTNSHNMESLISPYPDDVG